MYLAFFTKLIGTYPVLDGISADTKIVLNTPLSCDEAAEKYNIPTGTLYCLDALSIAMDPDPALTWLCSVRLPERVLLSRWIPLKHSAKILLGKIIRPLIGANLQGLKMGYEKQLKKKFLTELASPSSRKRNIISGATKTPDRRESIHAPAARYQMTSPPPAKVYSPLFAGSVHQLRTL